MWSAVALEARKGHWIPWRLNYRVVNHASCSLGSYRSSVRSVISVFNHSHLSCTNFVLFYLFWDIVSLNGPGWSGTHCVDKADLKPRDSPSMSLEYWN